VRAHQRGAAGPVALLVVRPGRLLRATEQKLLPPTMFRRIASSRRARSCARNSSHATQPRPC